MEELLKEKLLLEAEIKKLNDKLNENYVKRNEMKASTEEHMQLNYQLSYDNNLFVFGNTAIYVDKFLSVCMYRDIVDIVYLQNKKTLTLCFTLHKNAALRLFRTVKSWI